MDIAIFDIDGTLADTTHRQHFMERRPKDWVSFYGAMALDPPRAQIVRLARACDAGGIKVILCSGRPRSYRRITEIWMAENGVPYRGLYMRADGDYRDDVIVKIEMLSLIRAVFGEPMLVVDDRAKVVKMWRAEGLTCLQCAPGDF